MADFKDQYLIFFQNIVRVAAAEKPSRASLVAMTYLTPSPTNLPSRLYNESQWSDLFTHVRGPLLNITDSSWLPWSCMTACESLIGTVDPGHVHFWTSIYLSICKLLFPTLWCLEATVRRCCWAAPDQFPALTDVCNPVQEYVKIFSGSGSGLGGCDGASFPHMALASLQWLILCRI